MAVVSVVAASSVVGGSTSITILKPTGTIDADFMIMFCFVHDGAAPGTPPAGWSVKTTITLSSKVFWYSTKWASGEGSSYIVSGAADSIIGAIISLRGAKSTGTINAQSQRFNSVSPNRGTTSITTTVDGCMIISAFGGQNDTCSPFSAWTCTSPATLTEYADGFTQVGSDTSIGIAAALKATAGATGVSSMTLTTWDANGCFLLAIAPAPSGYTLPANAGSITLTGATTALKFGRKVIPAAGSVSLTGETAAINAARKISIAPDAYAMTGTAVALKATKIIGMGSESYGVSGQSLSLLWKKVLAAEGCIEALTAAAGGFILTATGDRILTGICYPLSGKDVSLRYEASKALICDYGNYVFSGQPASLFRHGALPAGVGSFVVTGSDGDLLWKKVLGIGPGSMTTTGIALSLLWNKAISIGSTSFIMTGVSQNLLRAGRIDIGAQSYLLTGQTVTLTHPIGYQIEISVGSYLLTGQTVKIYFLRKISIGSSSYAITGVESNLEFTRVMRLTDPGNFTMTGKSATLRRTAVLIPDLGAVVLTGLAVGTFLRN